MKWFGRLFCLVAAVGGFAAAHLLAQDGKAAIPTVPTVSVTVPTLPVPTVTTPTLPVPSVPTPTVPIPVPSTPVPTVPRHPRRRRGSPGCATAPGRDPAARDNQSGADTASRSADDLDDGHRPLAAAGPRDVAVSVPQLHPLLGLDVVGRADSSATPSATARPQRALQARVQRSRNRVSVRLAFLLPKADRLFVIVRGPAPSCGIAGYIPVRGHKGANTVFFAGRVHGRRLEPGVYLLSLSTNRRLDPAAATAYVRVVSRRRSVPLPEQAQKPSCSDVAGASTSDAIERTVLAGAVAKTSKPRPTASLAGTAAGSPSGDENDDGASGLPDSGVLGAATDVADEQPFVAIAVLTIVGALLLTMLVLVTRFLRGTWNP